MDLSTASRFILLSVSVGVIWRILTSIYQATSNPLNEIPGPWHARFTNVRLKLAVITGRRMFYVDSMHRQYGPIVRLTPTEIAVSDPTAFQTIHKVVAGFHKSTWYQDLTETACEGLQQDISQNAWEPLVRSKIELTVRMMKNEGRDGTPVDIFKWWTLLATDVSSHLMFGKSFEMIEKGKADTYIQTLQATMQGSGIGVELPLIRFLGRFIPTSTCQQMFDSGAFLKEYGTQAIRGNKARGETTNIFAKIISESEKGENLTEDDVVEEATALIVAGSDTTGVTLTYLVWAVLSCPELRKALEDELATLPAAADGKYSDGDLEKLVLFNAVIEETLRLYGAAPGGLPRETPPGGINLAGYFIPGGTTVTTQAYTIHRNEEIFDNAHEFDPRRWLALNDSETAQTQQEKLAKMMYHPFGAGSRVCLGVHLARTELRLGAAEFLGQCKGARLAASTTPESMEMENFFLIAPRSHRCDVVFDS